MLAVQPLRDLRDARRRATRRLVYFAVLGAWMAGFSTYLLVARPDDYPLLSLAGVYFVVFDVWAAWQVWCAASERRRLTSRLRARGAST